MAFSLSLEKTEQIFSLELSKKGVSTVDLPSMEVRVAIDKSGSMVEEFKSGFVDSAIDLCIVTGMKFDDNGEVEVGFFNHEFHHSPNATSDDYGCYLENYPIDVGGGTNFFPILENFYSVLPETTQLTEIEKPSLLETVKSWFKKTPKVEEVEESPFRVSPSKSFLFIITDGQVDMCDKAKVESLLQQASPDTFIYFIGIGNDVDANFINKLTKEYDHIDSHIYKNPSSITVEQFYENMFTSGKLLSWIK